MFDNRRDAGRQLARQLDHLSNEDVVVVGLPRGGVPVAAEVAQHLRAPLDVILVRKLGLPFQPELAMGAIGEGGVRVLNADIISRAGITESELSQVEERERRELERRARLYRSGRDPISLAGRVVVVIDDGIATGSTAKAACQVARAHGARRVVLAVPVAPGDWKTRLSGTADELISLTTPPLFAGVGQFYRDFSQTGDREVIECLDRESGSEPDSRGPVEPRPRHDVRANSAPTHDGGHSTRRPTGDSDVQILLERERLGGHLTIPENPLGVVIFVHGSGSSRHSPRNRFVAEVLNRAGLATLLFDLLTNSEERDRANVFDIELLSKRLADVTASVASDPDLEGLPIGYFGASTGAAAALRAAATPSSPVGAVVSRGGRPDLAASSLGEVRAPTLLIVGGLDRAVLDLNRQAQAQLVCSNELRVVPGATHLFEEPGTLRAAAELARNWFVDHLALDAEQRPGAHTNGSVRS